MSKLAEKKEEYSFRDAMKDAVQARLEEEKHKPMHPMLEELAAGPVPDTPEAMHNAAVTAIRTVYDPEIPVNLYDLGLIYDVRVKGDEVEVDMTLTAPACPVAEEMPLMVERAIRHVPGVKKVTARLVWDPPWDRSRMSEEALLELGLL